MSARTGLPARGGGTGEKNDTKNLVRNEQQDSRENHISIVGTSASSMFHERPFIDDALVLHKLGSSVLDFWFGGAVLINSLAAVAAFQNES